jgi:hypothetical protein
MCLLPMVGLSAEKPPGSGRRAYRLRELQTAVRSGHTDTGSAGFESLTGPLVPCRDRSLG